MGTLVQKFENQFLFLFFVRWLNILTSSASWTNFPVEPKGGKKIWENTLAISDSHRNIKLDLSGRLCKDLSRNFRYTLKIKAWKDVWLWWEMNLCTTNQYFAPNNIWCDLAKRMTDAQRSFNLCTEGSRRHLVHLDIVQQQKESRMCWAWRGHQLRRFLYFKNPKYKKN